VNPSHQDIQELLPVVILGLSTSKERREVVAALETDATLQREAQAIELALTGLGALENTPAPAGLKLKLMEQIRAEKTGASPAVLESEPTQSKSVTRLEPVKTQSRFRLPFFAVGLALAAAIGGLIVTRLAITQPLTAMPDASVIANIPNGGLIVANSGARATPVTFIAANGSRRNVSFKLDKPANFTRAVSSQGLSYVLDAANAKLFIIDESKATLIDEWPVQAGASGLAVDGESVVTVGASSGTALTFRRNGLASKTMVEARIAGAQPDMPSKEFSDAAVITGNSAYVTHHSTGTINEIDLRTGREKTRFTVGREPISLAIDGEILYVLDRAGSLYKLERQTGRVLAELKLEGNPDRLTLAPNVAYLSDRNGFVTAVQTSPFKVLARKQLSSTLMDLTPMPDGHIAVAAAEDGVMILNENLELQRSF
jgi:hypothetical protein